jgi:hypothetical protein
MNVFFVINLCRYVIFAHIYERSHTYVCFQKSNAAACLYRTV